MGIVGPAGARRRGRRRGLAVGMAAGHAMGKRSAQGQQDEGGGDDSMAQLEELGRLHQQGVLTDEEFAAKKKQILGE